MDALSQLADLIKTRNAIDARIAAQIGRAAEKGHVGEFIAAQIFGITLHRSASHPASDGLFSAGALAGRSVNIKWYARYEGLIDLPPRPGPATLPDEYLVMVGPKPGHDVALGPMRPWLISAVYLFDAAQLVVELRDQGVTIGVATSLRHARWDSAEIYPIQANRRFIVTDATRRALDLFAP